MRRLISTLSDICRAATLLFILTFYFAGVPDAGAVPASFYAPSSRLASGNWAKIEVKETGMQLISNATLKSLGFADPSKVNVYGYGGRVLSERLNSSMTDDLPEIPSVVTNKGILFFGYDCIRWTAGYDSYSHSLNPYSSSSYYFISDSNPERPAPQDAPELTSSSDYVTSFLERRLHEQDITAPYNSGRLILGEDFKTQPSRSFSFQLPGLTPSGTPTIKVAFGAKVSNGSSSLNFNVNGKEWTEKINGVPSSETFIVRNEFFYSVTPADKINIKIDYSNTGALFTAALDYIELFYPRELNLSGSDLHFYVNNRSSTNVELSGADSSTVIWDVTDPENPLNVRYSLEGDKARFVAPAGSREFVAFKPEGVSRSVAAAGRVPNQDIHSMPAPGMLIISPDKYKDQAQRLADLHANTDGLECLVLSPEQVYNEFSSGTPDVTAFRKLLKMWYDRGDGIDYTRHCLIMSRPSYDSKMTTPAVRLAAYPRVPIWQSPTGFTEALSYSTDDYIGMLADNNSDLNMNNAKIHVAVGRMPVKSEAEARNAVDKLEKYLTSPTFGAWRNNVMVIADDQDNGVHLTQAQSVCAALEKSVKGADYVYERLYLDAYKLGFSGTGSVYPEAKKRMLEKWNEGVMLIDYIGHANPKSWGHENLLTWTDITGMKNKNLPFLYAATCEFLRWDADEVSGGEELWLNPSAGVIGMICPSRTVYISLNGTLNTNTAKYMFATDSEGRGLTVGEIMINGKNDILGENNKLRYALMGDPAMRLPVARNNVSVDCINGVDVANVDDIPVVEALSSVKLSGRVTDHNGNRLEDFNGDVELQVYDAETVVTTNGNGADGVSKSYNDRKTRLFIGKTKAVNGDWEATVHIPSEIGNNFSPAFVSLYASDTSGREASGSSDNFIIYGFNTQGSDDTEGPLITSFFLNSPSFSNGGSVSPSPLVLAGFSDPSGINVSEGGIGHNMTLTLDGKRNFTDLLIYYSPNSSDPNSGSISYPLSGIEPGEHELTLTVWDNANNSSSASLRFNVSASWLPEITRLSADASPATTGVNFLVATDGNSGDMGCEIEVINLDGKTVWKGSSESLPEGITEVSIPWNLVSDGGTRVARGIYLYRATVTTANGARISKTRKFAVAAP